VNIVIIKINSAIFNRGGPSRSDLAAPVIISLLVSLPYILH